MTGEPFENERGIATPRPERIDLPAVPPLPDVAGITPDEASTTFSRFRSNLSRFRTNLSEHRTDLSEFRTDLSQHRTGLSENRTEMSMRRTGMSFHRTRMSADRTLMSEIRTALSLIGFGFTIYQAFAKLHEAGVIGQSQTPRNFGVALIVLGILLLFGGIARHVQFALELRASRKAMTGDGLIHGETVFPVSLTLVVAVLLAILGIAAVLGIVFNISGMN
ncbi:uncharacterized membrane protein YidH (DUF202 family) [Novosphingobium sp. PhB55]|uniref:YidH family protein n=1 Tax=Novosphingobium sp. PhB55 TaxID=2485106 RepID=UPI0010649010|nr:DUF202 domain-containing protein [Novosphingobium sp. PhB55]TDW68983.1 uncharacterized membrane protein YidH (DUF202 family) [Novosphingobium sp. PhB55]